MKLVVDTGVFCEVDTLRTFLSQSSSNHLILTDYVAIETLRGRSEHHIFETTEALAEFHKQIIILKPISKLIKLSGRTSRLTQRMIDDHQTRGFLESYNSLRQAKDGNLAFQMQIHKLRSLAEYYVSTSLKGAKNFSEGLEFIYDTYSDQEIKILRKNGQKPTELKAKFASLVIELTMLLRDNWNLPSVKSLGELKNTFLFRQSVCLHTLVLWNIRNGFQQSHGTRLDRVRNDLIDTTFSASATYFDGLLSRDKKQAAIYFEAKEILNGLFKFAS